jgi:hypothetical protein
MTIQMKENPGVVETVIDMLNHILVDGETMEYILEKTGMEYQMLKQLMVKTSIDDLEYLTIMMERNEI